MLPSSAYSISQRVEFVKSAKLCDRLNVVCVCVCLRGGIASETTTQSINTLDHFYYTSRRVQGQAVSCLRYRSLPFVCRSSCGRRCLYFPPRGRGFGAEKSVLIKTRYSQTTFDKILDGDWRQSNEQAAKAICGGNGHQSLGIISMALLANDRLLAVVAPAPDADASSNL